MLRCKFIILISRGYFVYVKFEIEWGNMFGGFIIFLYIEWLFLLSSSIICIVDLNDYKWW